MTGWRIGYLAGPEALIAKATLLNAAQLASLPTFIQYACLKALTLPTEIMAGIYEARRNLVCRRLREMGLSFPNPTGAFYVFPDISRWNPSSDAFCRDLIRSARVAAVPGSCFGTEGHIRISCCCGEETLKEGMDRLSRYLQENL